MRLLIYRQSSTNTKWRFTKQKKSTLIHYQRHRKISYLGYKTQRVIIRILTLISKIKSYDDSGKHFRVKTQSAVPSFQRLKLTVRSFGFLAISETSCNSKTLWQIKTPPQTKSSTMMEVKTQI